MTKIDIKTRVLARYKADFGNDAQEPSDFLWLDGGLVVLVSKEGRDFEGDPNTFTGEGTVGKALAFYHVDGEDIRQRKLQ